MTTEPPARPQVGSVGSGTVLPEASPPPAQPSAQPTDVPYRPGSTMQDVADFFTEEEFDAMDRAREAVRSGAFTVEDAARYRPVNPAPMSADWWRADAAGGLRTVGEAIFSIGAGRKTNEEQVRAVTDYYDAHPDYLEAIPDYVRHQMAHFLKGGGYARIPMNDNHPNWDEDRAAEAKAMAADTGFHAFLASLPKGWPKGSPGSRDGSWLYAMPDWARRPKWEMWATHNGGECGDGYLTAQRFLNRMREEDWPASSAPSNDEV